MSKLFDFLSLLVEKVNQIKPDWSEIDTSSASYIKNKTHGTVIGQKILYSGIPKYNESNLGYYVADAIYIPTDVIDLVPDSGEVFASYRIFFSGTHSVDGNIKVCWKGEESSDHPNWQDISDGFENYRILYVMSKNYEDKEGNYYRQVEFYIDGNISNITSLELMSTEMPVIKTLDESYIPNTIARVSDIPQIPEIPEQVQPDASQRDRLAPDYIKNMPYSAKIYEARPGDDNISVGDYEWVSADTNISLEGAHLEGYLGYKIDQWLSNDDITSYYDETGMDIVRRYITFPHGYIVHEAAVGMEIDGKVFNKPGLWLERFDGPFINDLDYGGDYEWTGYMHLTTYSGIEIPAWLISKDIARVSDLPITDEELESLTALI